MRRYGWNPAKDIWKYELSHAGHVWEDMGGGMQICMVCELERDEP